VTPSHDAAPVSFAQAQAYVSGGPTLGPKKWAHSGKRQLALLRRLGLQRGHRVLEIGCGTLNMARFLLPVLDAGAYACVEPNAWLRKASLAEHPGLREALEGHAVPTVFLENRSFDGRELLNLPAFAGGFDFVFSHSILSHAAWWQLPLYLRNAAAVLKPGAGTLVASLMFHRPHGDPSEEAGDSMDESWVYPWVSTFSRATVRAEGRQAGLRVLEAPAARCFLTGSCAVAEHRDAWGDPPRFPAAPGAGERGDEGEPCAEDDHDWIVATREGDPGEL
jgi:SAM-dependent methyltransferase